MFIFVWINSVVISLWSSTVFMILVASCMSKVLQNAPRKHSAISFNLIGLENLFWSSSEKLLLTGYTVAIRSVPLFR